MLKHLGETWTMQLLTPEIDPNVICFADFPDYLGVWHTQTFLNVCVVGIFFFGIIQTEALLTLFLHQHECFPLLIFNVLCYR